MLHLVGYTSTTKELSVAWKFALKDIKQGQMPVIFKIEFKGQKGIFEMTNEYTAYPGENEVLIQDGLKYLITSKDFIEVKGQQGCYIKFKYLSKD